MSVKAWKRIITIFIILLIVALNVIAIRFALMYYWGKNEKTESETIVDLADYGIESIDEFENYSNILKFYSENKEGDSLAYQNKYPNLYVDNDFKYEDTSGTQLCYLTFDDGPNEAVTEHILDVLKEKGAKATFFVVYHDTEKNRKLLKRMVDEGHSIGVHTAKHEYAKMYSSVTAYLKDFNVVSEWVESVTGVKPEIFRFPGGSINTYNTTTYQEIISEMLRRGYTYFDWNCSAGDAEEGYVSLDEIVRNVLNYGTYERKIVLLHDGPGHTTTVDALPDIIDGLRDDGYELRALDKTVKPIRFDY